MIKRVNLTQLIDNQWIRGAFCPVKNLVFRRNAMFEIENSQYIDRKSVINRNVQNSTGLDLLGLIEGINPPYIKNIKNFCKLPCQIEKKMLYLYGCHNWVRKGKPRVIEGRKATGPKNQVFIKDSRAAEYGKARFFIFR